MIRLFTAVDEDELGGILHEHAADYSRHVLQLALASKLCSIVHSAEVSEELCEVVRAVVRAQFLACRASAQACQPLDCGIGRRISARSRNS